MNVVFCIVDVMICNISLLELRRTELVKTVICSFFIGTGHILCI